MFSYKVLITVTLIFIKICYSAENKLQKIGNNNFVLILKYKMYIM